MKRCTVFVIASILAMTGVTGAQVHLELVEPLRQDIPPDGSAWHELAPNFCDIQTQGGYEDNGDGHVSVCDFITLGGTRQHITWVGPTYHLIEHTSGAEWYAEPMDPYTGEDPFCEIWFEVHPDYGSEWHVEGWQDNGDGIVSECDNVLIRGIWWHIYEVNLNITVEPGSPVEQTTWGKIKTFFRRVF